MVNPLKEVLDSIDYYFLVIKAACSAGWKGGTLDYEYKDEITYKGVTFYLRNSSIEKIASNFGLFWRMCQEAENYLREFLKEAKKNKDILSPYILAEKLEKKGDEE